MLEIKKNVTILTTYFNEVDDIAKISLDEINNYTKYGLEILPREKIALFTKEQIRNLNTHSLKANDINLLTDVQKTYLTEDQINYFYHLKKLEDILHHKV